jgi:hypothetical protein
MKMKQKILTILFLFYTSMIFGGNIFFDARVEEYGQLEQVLGDKWNTIDSLIVHGPINIEDIKTIVLCAKEGVLEVANLQYAQVKDNKIPDFAFVDVSLYQSDKFLELRRIILPDNITEFGACAFLAMTLEQINIPASLGSIGEGCFENDRWLCSQLVIPEGVTLIPPRCFTWCHSLKEVILPSTLKTIDQLAFYQTAIEKMTFPTGLDSIGHSAIYDTHLAEIILPNTLNKIGIAAFQDNKKLKRIVFPAGITYLPKRVCAMCSILEEAEIPETVTKIDRNAFQLCYKLKTNMPANLRWVGADAFDACALDSIVFPPTLEYIEGGAFRDLYYIQKVYSLAQTPPVCVEHPLHINKGKGPFHGYTSEDTPLYVPVGSGDKYRQAFGWKYFTNIIEIDKSPTGISPGKIEDTGCYKIYGLEGKIVIEVPETLILPENYIIYSIEGQIVKRGVLTTTQILQMPSRGLYIVRVGNITRKVQI